MPSAPRTFVSVLFVTVLLGLTASPARAVEVDLEVGLGGHMKPLESPFGRVGIMLSSSGAGSRIEARLFGGVMGVERTDRGSGVVEVQPEAFIGGRIGGFFRGSDIGGFSLGVEVIRVFEDRRLSLISLTPGVVFEVAERTTLRLDALVGIGYDVYTRAGGGEESEMFPLMGAMVSVGFGLGGK